MYDRTCWLVDPAGTVIPVSLSKSTVDAYGPADAGAVFCRKLRAGDYVSCFGSLNMSRGRKGRHWQLTPATPGDLSASDENTWKADNAGN